MLNVSAISNRTLLGRAVRLPLRLLPGGLEVRIVQGPLRGKRWVVGSSNHGCWLGSYEFGKQRVIASAVRPGMVCLDIGANVGYYTLLFSELTGPRGTVVAFEPVLRNCEFLRRHVSMNGCGNVVVEELALSDSDGPARFDTCESSSEGHFSQDGSLIVKCARLDTLIKAGTIPPPDLMKVDVEGAEAAVLAGASELLARQKPVIFLATHGEGPRAECCRYLREFGYCLTPIGGAAIESCEELVAQAQ